METQVAQCCITQMQYRHNFCNNAQHLMEKIFVDNITGTHRNILKLRFCTSSCSSASVHGCSTGSLRRHQAARQCSTLHSFSSTPTHSTFFSLDCASLCPIYCFTTPAELPPKPKIVPSVFPPLHFQLLSTLSLLSRSPSTHSLTFSRSFCGFALLILF